MIKTLEDEGSKAANGKKPWSKPTVRPMDVIT